MVQRCVVVIPTLVRIGFECKTSLLRRSEFEASLEHLKLCSKTQKQGPLKLLKVTLWGKPCCCHARLTDEKMEVQINQATQPKGAKAFRDTHGGQPGQVGASSVFTTCAVFTEYIAQRVLKPQDRTFIKVPEQHFYWCPTGNRAGCTSTQANTFKSLWICFALC